MPTRVLLKMVWMAAVKTAMAKDRIKNRIISLQEALPV